MPERRAGLHLQRQRGHDHGEGRHQEGGGTAAGVEPAILQWISGAGGRKAHRPAEGRWRGAAGAKAARGRKGQRRPRLGRRFRKKA